MPAFAPSQKTRRLPFLWLLITALGALAAAFLLPQGAWASPPPPGPCEDGYVAPTPVEVPVTSVPITVTSTTDDYFVLYVETSNLVRTVGPVLSPTSTLAVSVTRGKDGTTTLADNLAPLPAGKYRVEKYSVAQPGDVDGDCLDDLTELADMGTYNPINPARKVGRAFGAVTIDSLTTFQELSLRGDWKLGDLSHLGNLEWINYVISRAQTDQPVLHFINSSLGVNHGNFHNVTGVPVQSIYTRGSIVYHPNVQAPDGSLGIYRFSFDGLESGPFVDVQKYYETLAASMPVLKNNLYYYPTSADQVRNYNREKSKFDASRVNVLTQEDILGDVDYIAMNQGEGYGRLRHMEEGERPSPFDVAIYEALPNDLPRVAGTITTVPQTPLSHVNLRAIQNNLPNAFIKDALTEESIAALLDKYVYYAVTADGYTIRAATKADVDKHFEDLRPENTQTLQSDLTKKTIASLDDVSFADWTAFGVKAANVAELTTLPFPYGTTPVGYAVPFYFYVEFMKQATLDEETILGKKKAPDEEKITLAAGTTLAEAVTAILAHSHFQTDADIQEEMLDDLRKAIKKAQSPAWIITALENLHAQYPDGQSLRYRSSTNNEDLPSFSGAGLYSSKTQKPEETTAEGIDKSIKQVWASLWNYRAFLERDFHRVDHTTVVMGVLVHPNYSDETVNGVAVSYDPITFQDDLYYVNSQKGEDLVTNPEAHSQPEQLLLGTTGKASILSYSNLAPGNRLLMSDEQMVQLRSNLKTIHDHFKTLYEVEEGEDFAIEIEFKITAANKLAIKQARPWIFPEPLTLAKPEATIALGSAQVTEGGALEVTATRSGGILSTPLTVDLSWSETLAMLTDSNPASITIPGNQTSATITVSTDDDEEDEHESVVTVSIAANDRYTVGTPGSVSATVTDNDLPTIGVSGAAGTVTEGSPVVFNFTRSGSVLEQSLSVNITVTDSGSRLQDAAPTTATFPADSATASISLPTANDGVWAAPRDVKVQIDADSGYNIDGSGKAKVTIKDDDPRPPTPRFDLNHHVPSGRHYSLTTDFDHVNGDLTITVGGPDRGHFIDHANNAELIVLHSQRYDRPNDANRDGVYEIDITASASQGGTSTARVRFTVTNPELISIAQQHWDQLSAEQRATLLPEVASHRLKPQFADLVEDVKASVLRLERQGLLPSPGLTISIAGGSGITEGGDASFTISADPAPDSAITVNVGVSQDGDWGATGAATVSVSGASTTYTITTGDDQVDEADGSVTATVQSGSGYTVGSAAWATVNVADDDDPPPATPEITISGGASITEGGTASFTITANPAPDSAITVNIGVSQSGDFGASGAATVTVSGASTTYTITTGDDQVDEADGSVTATVNTGTGYTVSGTQGAATVAVSDDDVPELSIAAGGGIAEGGQASFTVTASPSPYQALSVAVTVTDSGDFASSGQAGSRTITVPKTGSVSFSVGTDDDGVDEADGTITATLSAGLGYTLGASTASVAVSDDDSASTATFTPDASLLAALQAVIDGHTTNTGAIERLTKIKQGIKGEAGGYTATECRDEAWKWGVNATWKPWCDEIERRENFVPGLSSDPEISITGGVGVTEVTPASFTITASPAPATSLDVTVDVTQSGDFAATGQQTITIPAAGTATLTVATTDDNTDEADGSVTATLVGGIGYTISGSNGAATVAVADNDVPALSITAGGGITEGGNASFTVTASPAPYQALTVAVTVSDSGDFASSGQAGSRTITVPITGSVSFSVGTVDDGVDEADGTITSTLAAGSGYTLGAATASVAVADDDGPALSAVEANAVKVLQEAIDHHRNNSGNVAAAERFERFLALVQDANGAASQEYTDFCPRAQNNGWTMGVGVCDAVDAVFAARQAVVDPEISITAGAGITEGGSAVFTITASPAPAADLTVSVNVTQQGDYGVTTGSRNVTIPATGSATFTMSTTDDGSVTATVSAGSGYTVSATQGSATVAVSDNDVPEISIAGAAGITEGGSAVFTLTASPAPYQSLTVSVNVAQQGDYGVTAGAQTVTIGTSGTGTLAVTTADDGVDEADGSVTATLQAGLGYSVGASGVATIAVSDNDDPPPSQNDPPSQSELEASIQERIDLTARKGDNHSNRIWRGALAAVRGEDTPPGAREVDAAFAQRLSDNHGSKGRAELSQLWQAIADALSG